MSSQDEFPREKKWKNISLRSTKVHRAKQLGLEQPHKNQRHQVDSASPLNLLFVCSKNQWRSPTGEAIYRKHPQLNTRSAGTSSKARHQISHPDLKWADIIFVMESKHRQRLLADFPEAMRFQELHVLDIEDNYHYMDPELVTEIKTSVDAILTARPNA